LKILFVSDNLYIPQLSGGAEVSIRTLCHWLKGAGHEVAVSAVVGKRGIFRYKSRLGAKAFGDSSRLDMIDGCRVFRDWSCKNSLDEAIGKFSPDIAILMKNSQELLIDLIARRIPALVYLRDIYFKNLNLSNLDLSHVMFIANSKFTHDRFMETFGINSEIILPLVDRSLYRVHSSRKSVLFVNPHPMKGVDIAVELVLRNSDIPFIFAESWPVTTEVKELVKKHAKNARNLLWLKSRNDMRTLYSSAGLVLMPSQCEESWGRVASEAHISGIPVLGSHRGALPESIGPGGVLIENYTSVDAWDEILKHTWSNHGLLSDLGEKAVNFSNRVELDENGIIANLLFYAERLMGQSA
jgi:glycosyltransferase involved in cell wall biosynthesis